MWSHNKQGNIDQTILSGCWTAQHFDLLLQWTFVAFTYTGVALLWGALLHSLGFKYLQWGWLYIRTWALHGARVTLMSYKHGMFHGHLPNSAGGLSGFQLLTLAQNLGAVFGLCHTRLSQHKLCGSKELLLFWDRIILQLCVCPGPFSFWCFPCRDVCAWSELRRRETDDSKDNAVFVKNLCDGIGVVGVCGVYSVDKGTTHGWRAWNKEKSDSSCCKDPPVSYFFISISILWVIIPFSQAPSQMAFYFTTHWLTEPLMGIVSMNPSVCASLLWTVCSEDYRYTGDGNDLRNRDLFTATHRLMCNQKFNLFNHLLCMW